MNLQKEEITNETLALLLSDDLIKKHFNKIKNQRNGNYLFRG